MPVIVHNFSFRHKIHVRHFLKILPFFLGLFISYVWKRFCLLYRVLLSFLEVHQLCLCLCIWRPRLLITLIKCTRKGCVLASMPCTYLSLYLSLSLSLSLGPYLQINLIKDKRKGCVLASVILAIQVRQACPNNSDPSVKGALHRAKFVQNPYQ